MAALDAGHLLGRAGRDDLASARSALGPQVDDPVRGLDDIEIVLDDDHGVALVDESAEDLEQAPHVLEVESGGRLVEDVDGAPVGAALQLGRELDALRLAAGEGRGRLAEPDVAEATSTRVRR